MTATAVAAAQQKDAQVAQDPGESHLIPRRNNGVMRDSKQAMYHVLVNILIQINIIISYNYQLSLITFGIQANLSFLFTMSKFLSTPRI